MMSTEERNWDLKAAEYVLGTVVDEERKVLDKLYEVDNDWQQRVHRWQARLNPLHESTPSVEPPGYIFAAIKARIHNEVSPLSAQVQSSAGSSSTPDHAGSATQLESVRQVASSTERLLGQRENDVSSTLETLKQWKARARYWQMATLFAVASLAGVVMFGPAYLARQLPVTDMVRTVAVLQSEKNQPLWTIMLAPATGAEQSEVVSGGVVSVTVVGEPTLSDTQSHQLWMVLPEGAGVRSVGLVPNESGETATFILPIPLEEAAEFAVSLEPFGGVPGPEHGPVVTRTFIIKTPSQTDV